MIVATLKNIYRAKNADPVSFLDMMPADASIDDPVDAFDQFKALTG